jgi:hypothetical protein
MTTRRRLASCAVLSAVVRRRRSRRPRPRQDARDTPTVAIVGGQGALLETALAREWAEHARVITLEAATRSVARHVHCVRGAELAFLHSVFRRFVLRRDEDPLNDIERLTVGEFETALGDEWRRHFERWAQRALAIFLPLDRAFALFGARGMDDTHWFSEQHACERRFGAVGRDACQSRQYTTFQTISQKVEFDNHTSLPN